MDVGFHACSCIFSHIGCIARAGHDDFGVTLTLLSNLAEVATECPTFYRASLDTFVMTVQMLHIADIEVT